MTTLYRKQGRRYVPVSEYDPVNLDSFPAGDHLVSVRPGITSRRFRIDPALAPMIAASLYAEDAISHAIMRASELRLNYKCRDKPFKPGQKEAWDNLVRVFGDDARQLEWPSIRECAEAGARALIEEAEKLMTNESVREAYEHFLLVCELSKKHEKETV
mgnify:FL=1